LPPVTTATLPPRSNILVLVIASLRGAEIPGVRSLSGFRPD
jgi:hypothetical protein